MTCVLTIIMIVGFSIIVSLFILKFRDLSQSRLSLPESIDMPNGAAPLAFTVGPDWYAIVASDDEILVFDRANGRIIQRIPISR